MQPDKQRILSILKALRKEFGTPTFEKHDTRPLLDQTIRTILSQQTTSALASMAFANLQDHFSQWEEVRRSKGQEVTKLIRCAGLADQKERAIRGVLDRLYETRHELSLEFLHELENRDAMDYLLTLPGVGPKTASCVLLFGMGRFVIPVDTHVSRLARRLEIVSENTKKPAAIQDALENIVPEEYRFQTHVLLFEHGRATCKSQRPHCTDCSILKHCPTGQRLI